MKKSLVLAGMLLASSLYASENKYFVSVGLGKAYETIEADSYKNSDDGNSFSLGLGTFLNDSSRVSFVYTKYTGLGDTDYTSSSDSTNSIEFSYDYFVPMENNELDIKPFIGAGYRILDLSVDDNDGKNINLKTNMLLLKVGLEKNIDEKFYLDIAYDYALTTSGSKNLIIDGSSINAEVTDFRKLEFSVGYRF